MDMECHSVLVILKDHSFIPEVITASWRKGTNVLVTFQNEDDYAVWNVVTILTFLA